LQLPSASRVEGAHHQRNGGEFRFEPEYSETFEAGVKGTCWGNHGRYDVTLFNTEFTDLQIQVPTGLIENESRNVNAGGQRVRGLELSTALAVSERLLVNAAAAFMHGEYTYFPFGGCSFAERTLWEQSGCDPETGTMDRTGQETDGTPDWMGNARGPESQPGTRAAGPDLADILVGPQPVTPLPAGRVPARRG
jgi:outer membrane receptor protein involved in Fe transport